MIDQATQDKISDLGFDVPKLVDAVKSEEDVSLDVPTLFKEKGHTKEEMTIFGQNRFNEGKDANEEILAKSYHDQFELNLPDGKDGRKNLAKVFEAFGEKKFNEAKPDGDTKELQSNFQTLQKNNVSLQEELENEKNKNKSNLFSLEQRGILSKEIPKSVSIKDEQVLNLYLMENDLVNTEGSAFVKVNGEIQKDTLLNPIPAIEHFKTWIDASGLAKKEGMGGEDSKGGGSVTKFKNAQEFMEYAKANNIEPMSTEGQKFLAENKAEQFSYN